jgi:hypothetical protein
MKTLVSTLTALVLALLLVVPALAAGDEQEDTVTKTLKLTLYGDVPEDRVFGAFYYVSPETHPAGLIQFCGPDVPGGEAPSQVVSEKDCQGGGTAYTASAKFDTGTGVFVEFVTLAVSDPQNTLEIFAESPELKDPESLEYEVLNTDTTNTASYRFGANNGQQMPEMPSSGAGGMGSSHSPIARMAAMLLLLAAGACVLRRTAGLSRKPEGS